MNRPYSSLTDAELAAVLRAEAAELVGTKTAAGLLSSVRLLEQYSCDQPVRDLLRAQAIGQIELVWYVRQDLKGRAA